MHLLVVGAGGVGEAVAAILRRRSSFARIVLADLDGGRAQRVAARLGEARIAPVALDASDADAIVALCRAEGVDVLLNAVDPRLNPPVFAAARAAGVTYVDMAMTLSGPGVLLGQAQLAAHADWEAAGLLALVGMGVEPGFADVAARFAADVLFAEVDEWPSATAPTSSSRATRSRRRSRSGRRSRSA